MEQNNPDGLENPEIAEEAVVAKVLMTDNVFIKKMEKIISQLNKELNKELQ
jgi:hypothetical protein